MAIRITCINKANGFHQDPHHAIESLGWLNEETGKTGKNSRLEIYNWLKDKNGSAYVKDRNLTASADLLCFSQKSRISGWRH